MAIRRVRKNHRHGAYWIELWSYDLVNRAYVSAGVDVDVDGWVGVKRHSYVPEPCYTNF